MNHVYEVLASSLEYPGADWGARLEGCLDWLTVGEPEVARQFNRYSQRVKDLPIEKLEELYTRTFDLNPVCTLDIGYHVFGENYKRGELLAKLRETEEPFELGQANQLPDHLPVLLRLLPKLEDEELRLSLIAEILVPALGKMLQALIQTNNPYRDLIETISSALKNEAPECGARGLLPGEEIPELYRISSKARAC
jgi:nitrate reductase delta subunit